MPNSESTWPDRHAGQEAGGRGGVSLAEAQLGLYSMAWDVIPRRGTATIGRLLADLSGGIDREALERRLRAYYEAYYSDLRQRMSRYPAASEIFPYYLKGYRRIVATLTKDGLVSVHYPAERDSFEFRTDPRRRVRDITEHLAIVYPNGLKAVHFPRDPGNPEADFDGAMAIMAPEADYNGRIIRPDWVRLEVAGMHNLDEDLHSEAKARKDATTEATFAADAYLMGLEKVPPDRQKDRVIAELEFAIDEFEQVVARDPHERIIQEYLSTKRNQILLDPSALSITPHVYLRNDHEIDFAVQEAEEQYVLVEIERSGLPVLTKKGRPRAELTHAQQQVKDWFEWIGENREYARSKMPGIREPKGRVIMGRRSSILPEHRHVLARESAESRRITTQTYDDLLDRAKQHLANLRNM